MAGNIVEISDFIGSVAIQEGKFTTPNFDDIRDEWTNHHIRQLLGAELGNLFIASLVNGVPSAGRFKTIFDPFSEDINSFVNESLGIKYMIKVIIWFYFARNNNVDVQLTGNVSSLAENSESSTDGFNLVRNYNKGIRTGRAIQRFIRDNSATYPEYKGQRLLYTTPS